MGLDRAILGLLWLEKSCGIVQPDSTTPPPPITASAGSGKDPSQWALVGGPWVGWATSVVFSNHSDAGDGGDGGVGRGVPAGLIQP